MSCPPSAEQLARAEEGDLPEWFDNLGSAYAGLPVPGVRQLGRLMQGISAVDELLNGPNYSLSNIGKAWGGIIGMISGGVAGGLVGGELLAGAAVFFGAAPGGVILLGVFCK